MRKTIEYNVLSQKSPKLTKKVFRSSPLESNAPGFKFERNFIACGTD